MVESGYCAKNEMCLNRVIRNVLKEGENGGFDPSLRELFLKSSFVCCTLEHIFTFG